MKQQPKQQLKDMHKRIECEWTYIKKNNKKNQSRLGRRNPSAIVFCMGPLNYDPYIINVYQNFLSNTDLISKLRRIARSLIK